MSRNPFAADPARAARYANAEAEKGAAVRTAVAQLWGQRGDLAGNGGGVIAGPDARALVARFELADLAELMVLAVGAAKALARPPISRFEVGAVGLEAGSGDLIFGGNVEFPGTHLGFTLHGEGFVATRAFSRGTALSVIAIGEAHPCAHCRQYLSEFVWGEGLRLIDPLGHDLGLDALYPWPFDPGYLGERGAGPGVRNWPGLRVRGGDHAPDGLIETLLEAGSRSHTPYSRCPAAIALTLADGQTIVGTAIESVAFNPTIQPLQSAIVDLLAHGYAYDDIRTAALGTVRGGAVDYARASAELLAAVAPRARLAVIDWEA